MYKSFIYWHEVEAYLKASGGRGRLVSWMPVFVVFIAGQPANKI